MRLLLLVSLLLVSCAAGPDYRPPRAELETAFKNAGFQAPPPKGSWWTLFRDSELDRLVSLAANAPSAQAALARYDAARGALGLARADTSPAISGAAYARRQRDSGSANFSAGTYNDYRAAMNLTWEIDFWGRVRRGVRAAVADRDAAMLDYQAALLSLRGEIARAYLSLRFADAEIALLDQTTSLRGEARRLIKKRFDRGLDNRIDYERAVAEHEGVLAELAQLRAQRGRYENALAALTGQSASGYHIAPSGRRPHIPGVPGAVPSDLLRRRPDLAAAERRLAAASERIGVAIANYLPRLSLTGQGGLQSLQATDLFDTSSRLWRIGPELSVPLFQGGRGSSDRARAEAAYREALANYRDALLQAVRDTEDSLGDQRLLARASAAQHRGSASANEVATLARKRFEGGVTDYFEVVDAERTSLLQQRTTLSIDLARALAATRLIEALGGGWK